MEGKILLEQEDLLFTRMYVPEEQIGTDGIVEVYKANFHPIDLSSGKWVDFTDGPSRKEEKEDGSEDISSKKEDGSEDISSKKEDGSEDTSSKKEDQKDISSEEKNYVALKIVNLGEHNNLYQETLRSAFYAHHKNLIGYTSDFNDGSKFYVVMPYSEKGSVRSIMFKFRPNGLPEHHIAIVLKECLLSVCFLHEVGHFHGDIDAGNIFFHGNSSVQLAFASTIYEHQENEVASPTTYLPQASIGSWAAPPELHNLPNKEYTQKGDIWMIGITALELAFGGLRVSSREELDVMIQQLMLSVGKKNFSRPFNDMLVMCLAKEPSKRSTASELLESPFFKDAAGENSIKDMIKCYEDERK